MVVINHFFFTTTPFFEKGSFPAKILLVWGSSSIGRTRASQVRGRGFDPPLLHHLSFLIQRYLCFCFFMYCYVSTEIPTQIPLLSYNKGIYILKGMVL
jgi:hypothetical protein